MTPAQPAAIRQGALVAPVRPPGRLSDDSGAPVPGRSANGIPDSRHVSVGGQQSVGGQLSSSRQSERQRRPELSAEPRDAQTREGQRVYMHCTATGTPTPNIIWYHNRYVYIPYTCI